MDGSKLRSCTHWYSLDRGPVWTRSKLLADRTDLLDQWRDSDIPEHIGLRNAQPFQPGKLKFAHFPAIRSIALRKTKNRRTPRKS
jgi:hypothetical protein